MTLPDRYINNFYKFTTSQISSTRVKPGVAYKMDMKKVWNIRISPPPQREHNDNKDAIWDKIQKFKGCFPS